MRDFFRDESSKLSHGLADKTHLPHWLYKIELVGYPTGALDIPSDLRYSSGPMRHPRDLVIPPLLGSSQYTETSKWAESPTPKAIQAARWVIPMHGISQLAWVDPDRVIPPAHLVIPKQRDIPAGLG